MLNCIIQRPFKSQAAIFGVLRKIKHIYGLASTGLTNPVTKPDTTTFFQLIACR